MAHVKPPIPPPMTATLNFEDVERRGRVSSCCVLPIVEGGFGIRTLSGFGPVGDAEFVGGIEDYIPRGQ